MKVHWEMPVPRSKVGGGAEKKQKGEKNVKPIEYNVSKLEKVLKMSDEETIAKAIRDLLLRDKENGDY